MSSLVLFSFEKVETMKIDNASLIGRNSKLLMKKLVFLDLERRKTMYVEKRLLKLVKTRIGMKSSNVHCSINLLSCPAIFVRGRNDENFGMKNYYDF